MENIAIQGDPKKSHKVINLLEMLGGCNKNDYRGDVPHYLYYIDCDGVIGCTSIGSSLEYAFFTLEQFIEKYPYVIGDKVSIPEYESEVRIDKMCWDGSTILYGYHTDEMEWCTADEMLDWNPIEIESSKSEESSIVCPEGYEFYDDKNNRIDSKSITIKKKPIEYPNTFVGCFRAKFGNRSPYNDCMVFQNPGYMGKEITTFQRIIFYRDAYWNLAGDLMGLNKSWAPRFENCNIPHYCIYVNFQGDITMEVMYGSRCILAFPTAEMRDAFYENFKELIESCKEFL